MKVYLIGCLLGLLIVVAILYFNGVTFPTQLFTSISSSTKPSYWVGTWTSDGGAIVDSDGNYQSHYSDNPITFTFNSKTMTVHVNLGSIGIEFDKEWAIIPDGSGVTFYDLNGETVSILAPDGKWYSKDLNTGRVSEVGMILKHIR